MVLTLVNFAFPRPVLSIEAMMDDRPAHRFIATMAMAAPLAFGLAVAVSAQGLKPDPAEGEKAAKRWCTQCHVVDDSANLGADAGPPFKALAADPSKTQSSLRAFLADPHEPMPPLSLTARDIDNLVAYILSLNLDQ